MKDARITAVLDSLMKCITACEHCANACMDESNAEEMKYCIRLDLDCADICGVTARLIARDSRHAATLMAACVEACRACEQECSLHKHEHCVLCAAACHECHTALEQYAPILTA